MPRLIYLIFIYFFLCSSVAQAQDTSRRVKCATPLELGINTFQKQKLARLQASQSYRSPSGRFTIYYDITGTDAVPSTDTNANGRPDYVESVARYADETYTKPLAMASPTPFQDRMSRTIST